MSFPGLSHTTDSMNGSLLKGPKNVLTSEYCSAAFQDMVQFWVGAWAPSACYQGWAACEEFTNLQHLRPHFFLVI